jgi:predicted PurR-regulated permease PerM
MVGTGCVQNFVFVQRHALQSVPSARPQGPNRWLQCIILVVTLKQHNIPNQHPTHVQQNAGIPRGDSKIPEGPFASSRLKPLLQPVRLVQLKSIFCLRTTRPAPPIAQGESGRKTLKPPASPASKYQRRTPLGLYRTGSMPCCAGAECAPHAGARFGRAVVAFVGALPRARGARSSAPQRCCIAPCAAPGGGSRRRFPAPAAGSRRPRVVALSGRELAGAAARSSGEALANIDAKRAAVWAAAAICVLLLRSFFPVLLGTFIVGYVANSVVQWVQRVSKGSVPRRAVVAFFYVGVVSAISGFSLLTVPTIVRESHYFVRTLQSENPYVIAANVMRRTLGDDAATKLEAFVIYSIEAPRLESSSLSATPPASSLYSPPPRVASKSKEAGVVVPPALDVVHPPVLVDGEWSAERSRRLGMLLRKSFGGYIAGIAALITKILRTSTKVVLKAVFSLIFSFMIMWDLPVIVSGIRRLGSPTSRLRYAYNELVPFVADFGSVLGKSFEAQGLIALVNTSLTTAGLVILSVPGVGFLSVVTLICSFIPVAGVFISTLPMLILALSEYGAAKALAVVLMVIVVHLIEAYVLNPQIYSAHLHLHPFLVLVVLYVAEHLYGIAGLLMAVPVSVYLLRSLVLGQTIGGGPKQLEELASTGPASSEGDS